MYIDTLEQLLLCCKVVSRFSFQLSRPDCTVTTKDYSKASNKKAAVTMKRLIKQRQPMWDVSIVVSDKKYQHSDSFKRSTIFLIPPKI